MKMCFAFFVVSVRVTKIKEMSHDGMHGGEIARGQ